MTDASSLRRRAPRNLTIRYPTQICGSVNQSVQYYLGISSLSSSTITHVFNKTKMTYWHKNINLKSGCSQEARR